MAIITKRVGRRGYAYLAAREGRNVVHKYLGPVDNERIKKMIAEDDKARRLPRELFSLFWDTEPQKIRLMKNARYVIERVLHLGNTDAIRWLQRVYPARTIINVLSASRALDEKSKNFWSIWFGVSHA
jgi:hypothetical protein